MRGQNSRALLAQILTANAVAATTPGGNSNPELSAIKRKLDQNTLKLTDVSIYTTKDASGHTLVRMFATSDVESKGISNITAAKLAIDQLVLVDRIRLQAASSSTAINGSATVLGALNFGTIAGHSHMTGGTYTIKQQNKNMQYQSSLRDFETTTRLDRPQGLYYLDSPLLLYPQQLLEFNIELGTAMADRQALRLELLGTQTSPF